MLVDPIPSFEWRPTTQVVFGAGALADLGRWTETVGGRRPLVVTDPGIEEAGHVDHALRSLKAAGLDPVLFDEVQENPTTETVDRGLAFARKQQIDSFIGLGGGSAMDTAKGINFLLTNGGRMADYWGVGKATQPMLPLVAVPTTAGTGSEAQSFALISDATTHQKMACGDKKAAAKIALLDPEITLSQPERVTAVSGMDAISHAIESYVSTSRHPISTMLAMRAWQLLFEGFPSVLDNPDDLSARSRMLLGSHLAGAAIEASMLGAAHALANPLTARFDLTHGIAVGLMLPHVVRWNGAETETWYDELHSAVAEPSDPDVSSSQWLAAWLQKMLSRANMPVSLDECPVPPSALSELSAEAATQWTGRFNPRPVTAVELESLYRQAYNKAP